MMLTKFFDIKDSIGRREFIGRCLFTLMSLIGAAAFVTVVFSFTISAMYTYQGVFGEIVASLMDALSGEEVKSTILFIVEIPFWAFAFQRNRSIGWSDNVVYLVIGLWIIDLTTMTTESYSVLSILVIAYWLLLAMIPSGKFKQVKE